MGMKTFILAIVLFHLATSITGGGIFELKLEKYSDNKGLDAEGDYCDSFIYLFKLTSCDFLFKCYVSLPNGVPEQLATIETKDYANQNVVVFGSDLNTNQRNPIKIRFTKWSGTVIFRMKITDVDVISRNDAVDDIRMPLSIEADGVRRHFVRQGHVPGSYVSFSVKVACDPGYFGPGCDHHCKPMNDASHGHFRCTKEGKKECLENWRHPDTDCKDKDPCSPSPCQNGGRCQATADNSYICQCFDGYRGPHCEKRVRPCELHDHCLHNGTCVNIGWTNSTCLCSQGWTGSFCEQDINECSERYSPCMNDATCVNMVGSYLCRCKAGFQGSHCQKDVNECESNNGPCVNGGTCTNMYGGYMCLCSDGYNGTHCETQLESQKAVLYTVTWKVVFVSIAVAVFLFVLLLICSLFILQKFIIPIIFRNKCDEKKLIIKCDENSQGEFEKCSFDFSNVLAKDMPPPYAEVSTENKQPPSYEEVNVAFLDDNGNGIVSHFESAPSQKKTEHSQSNNTNSA